MKGKYECLRCEGLRTGYQVSDTIGENNWEDIDDETVETIIDAIKPVMKAIGRLFPDHLPEKIREKLDAGEVIILTNFYIRKRKVRA